MPSGRTHLRIEAALLFGWTGLAGYLLVLRVLPPMVVVAFIPAYAFSMLFLSPDLDLARSRASRRWGIGRWLWIPYALCFRHRQLSHHPIFGPATRILYLAAVGGAIGVAVILVLGRPLRLTIPSVEAIAGALVGLYIPNLTHVVADRIVSRWRRRRRRL